jgi:hypothetical protein
MCDITRCRWVNHGDSFDVGDRRLAAVRPPLFDAPTTRGVFDARTGLHYSADSFGAFVGHHVEDVDRQEQVDRPRQRRRGLGMNTIVTTHGPPIRGSRVDEAFRLIRQVPNMEPWPEPTQEDFDLLPIQGEAAAAHHVPMGPPSARETQPASPP